MHINAEKKVRTYRFRSSVNVGEVYIEVQGLTIWTEQRFTQAAENLLADLFVQNWLMMDYTEKGEE